MSRRNPANGAVPIAVPMPESTSGGWALRLLQQAAALLLAVFGFLFCLLTSYQLDLPVGTLAWTAAAFALLSLAVFSVRRRGIAALICLLAAGAWVGLHASDLLQGALLLTEQAMAPLSLRLPDAMQALLLPADAAQALLLMTRTLQTILFFVAFFSGYFIVCLSNVPGLALSTLPLLVPAPFYLLSPSILAFFALFAAHLMVFAFNNGKRAPTTLKTGAYIPQNRRKAELSAQRSAQQALSLMALPLLAFAALLSGAMLPQEGYVRPEAIETLQQKIFSLDVGKDAFWKSNDGLTRGDLKSLSSIRFSGKTAIQVRVSDRRSLYLRDFSGALYSDDGWSNVSSKDFSALAGSVSGIAPQNLLAAAVSASGNSLSTFDLSVRNIDATPLSIWIPPGLVTRAEEITSAGYVQDTALAFASSANSSEYSLTAIPVGMALYSVTGIDSNADTDVFRRAYQNAAGGAYGLGRADGADAETVRQAASTYIDYVLDVYTTLPDDTRAAAERLCQTYGLQRITENGALNLAETCQQVHALLSERCAYAYSPPEIPGGVDFTTYFLEESRSGYCVHFATAATVLLRALGIPARYAEGYIVIRSDYDKTPDAQGFIDIEDTHAHAWVEVFDPTQLEWIPVEMTASASGSAEPTPDENGGQSGEPTFSPTEPAPTATPEPTPTPEPSPEETSSSEQSPDLTTDAAALPESTPTPAPADEGAAENASSTPGPGETASAASAPAERPPVWPLLIILSFVGLPLLLLIFRRTAHERRLRSFAQKDMNAAVLAVCRYALGMLRFAGAPPMQSQDTPDTYAGSVSRQIPAVDADWLESLLLSAQRARFSNRTCSRKERDDGILFVRLLASILPARLPRLKRLLFRWRYPAV